MAVSLRWNKMIKRNILWIWIYKEVVVNNDWYLVGSVTSLNGTFKYRTPCFHWSHLELLAIEWQKKVQCIVLNNREYLPAQIGSMNNRFHSEAKLPWSYDYSLANHIATNKNSTNREMPLFSRFYPSFRYLRKIFPPRVLKYSLFI